MSDLNSFQEVQTSAVSGYTHVAFVVKSVDPQKGQLSLGINKNDEDTGVIFNLKDLPTEIVTGDIFANNIAGNRFIEILFKTLPIKELEKLNLRMEYCNFISDDEKGMFNCNVSIRDNKSDCSVYSGHGDAPNQVWSLYLAIIAVLNEKFIDSQIKRELIQSYLN